MVRLSRTVRTNLGGASHSKLQAGVNGHGGQPAMTGLGTYYEFHIECSGEPDPVTGYLVNIKMIDQAVRASVLPRVQQELISNSACDPCTLLPELATALDAEMPVTLDSLCWSLSPFYNMEIRMDNPRQVLMRQRFEFAAAHRLNVSEFDEKENLSIFGKCNNPSGHGHNYEIEVCLRQSLDGAPMSVEELERIVDATVIQRFDHKHLNVDTAEFGDAGLNPSVENIAQTCYKLLAPEISTRSGNQTLESVTVWETPKTKCTYPAP